MTDEHPNRDKPVENRPVGDGLETCPSCGYRLGFHVHFHPQADGTVRVKLTCPDCGQRYDVGWTIMLTEE